MNIAAYCRVSTEKEDQLNSLELQKNFFTEFAQRNNYNLVRLYADEGLSGTKTKNRKQFLKMMEDAEKGIFDMVVVKDISRFARNTVDLLQCIRRLRELQIETHFLTANMTSMGNSEFVLTVFGALAQEESANTSKRVKFGKRINAEKGRVPNLVFGYDKSVGDYFNMSINKTEANVIRQIFQLYLNEGYGASKISKILNERGIKTKRGCKWTQNSICRILENELYTGKIINGKEEVSDFLTGKRISKSEDEWLTVVRPELSIISNVEFAEAKRLRTERANKFKGDKERHSNKHLFSTLIKCKECGSSFRRYVRTYKKTYVKWVCTGHNRDSGSCPNAISIDENELINVIEQYFSDLLFKKNSVSRIINELVKEYKRNEEDTSHKNEVKIAIERLKRSRQKYIDMYSDDLITHEELKCKIGHLKSELDMLESELQTLENINMYSDQLKMMLSDRFRKIEDLCNLQVITNSQLKKLIDRIEVDCSGNVEIILKFFINKNVRFCLDRT